MMKVFLSTPPGRTMEKWPPLGLLYLSASIRSHRPGDEVVIVDAFCRDMSAEELVDDIRRQSPDVVGMNCSTHTFLTTIEAMRSVSEALPKTTCILGGYHASFTAERILREYPFIRYIIKGEAEHALVQLLDCLENGGDPAEVDGISLLQDGVYHEKPLTIIDDLDVLPLPERSELGDLEYGYRHQGIPLTFGKFSTMVSSRGCPFDCSFCSCSLFSKRRWRPRSPENVVDELEILHKEGYRTVVLVDDNFTQDRERAMRICDLILERGIDMSLYCEGRVNKADKDLMRQMKKAGFEIIFFGTESASQHVLDYYNKRIQLEQIREAVNNAKEAGMMVITSFIMGAPIETEDDLENTIELITELRPHAVEINILDYVVGTRIWTDRESADEVGGDDWKTNHRAYEYRDGLSCEVLQSYVDRGYEAYISSWKSREGFSEMLRLFRRNRTARRIVLHNLFNREVWAMLSQKRKVN